MAKHKHIPSGGQKSFVKPHITIPADVKQLELTPEEKAAIKETDRVLGQKKFDLGNLEYSIAVMSEQRKQAVEDIAKAHQEYEKSVLRVAATHGVGKDAPPTNGTWQFRAADMVFVRVS